MSEESDGGGKERVVRSADPKGLGFNLREVASLASPIHVERN